MDAEYVKKKKFDYPRMPTFLCGIESMSIILTSCILLFSYLATRFSLILQDLVSEQIPLASIMTNESAIFWISMMLVTVAFTVFMIKWGKKHDDRIYSGWYEKEASTCK